MGSVTDTPIGSGAGITPGGNISANGVTVVNGQPPSSLEPGYAAEQENEKWWWVCCLEFCFCLLWKNHISWSSIGIDTLQPGLYIQHIWSMHLILAFSVANINKDTITCICILNRIRSQSIWLTYVWSVCRYSGMRVNGRWNNKY